MSHTDRCKKTARPIDVWAPCDCFEPDTDWSPEQRCGGIAMSVNGGPMSEPPWCEVHMKPWGHRATRRETEPETDQPEESERND